MHLERKGAGLARVGIIVIEILCRFGAAAGKHSIRFETKIIIFDVGKKLFDDGEKPWLADYLMA